MDRRHFVKHLAGASAWALPALTLTHSLRGQARQMSRDRKAAILIWLGGGASTMDMWDLKPGAQPVGLSSRSAPRVTCKSASTFRCFPSKCTTCQLSVR